MKPSLKNNHGPQNNARPGLYTVEKTYLVKTLFLYKHSQHNITK